MNIDFQGLRAFLAIAEHGSFRAAALHLNLSQTALSHRVRKVEDDLGVKLLSRTTRRVSLTEAGLTLLPKVQAAVEGLSSSLEELKKEGDERRQTLSIGCLPTIASGRLPSILRAFNRQQPRVHVQIFDLSASEIVELLQQGVIEFGLTMTFTDRWDFDTEVLLDDPFVLVCGPSHPLANRDEVRWSELSKLPLIRVSRRTGNRAIIDDALDGKVEGLEWQFEVQHLQTAIALAREGLAAAVIPQMSFPSKVGDDLRLIRLAEPEVRRQISIVSRRGKPLSPAAVQLRRFVVGHFAAG
ncbi:LysR family transcriptional regulator [Aureimonas sp. ME7]|uniref:LysR family transcriptional regulator n=1 Tax=Aureimonas sp. ME7 TaxID=2744252 RepID=UPI0015F55044|nr:LysR family transcriptional regulator [Aureimonas sp. ME7]